MTTGKHRETIVFTLWVWLHVGRHQLGKGPQVAYGACVCFCCGFETLRPVPDPPSSLQRAECSCNGQKRWKSNISICFSHVRLSALSSNEDMGFWSHLALCFHSVYVVSRLYANSNTSFVVLHRAARNTRISLRGSASRLKKGRDPYVHISESFRWWPSFLLLSTNKMARKQFADDERVVSVIH